MELCIVTVAVTGAETTREQQPNLPITPEEIADQAVEAWRAGAAICHLHVRRDDGTPTQDPAVFKMVMDRIRSKCDMIVEVTTGGAAGMSNDERLAPLQLRPEMASLDCGSVNFDNDVLINSLGQMRAFANRMKEFGVKPTLECFDLGHIHNARILIGEGLLNPPFYAGLVLGVLGGVTADIHSLSALIGALPPSSIWTGVGAGGKAAAFVSPASILLGGHPRVGFEDNIYLEKGVIAKSNTELVEKVAHLAGHMGRKIASPDQARKMLGL